MVWLSYGQIDVQDGAIVLIDKDGAKTHIPVGGLACVLLEPGTRVTHAAIALMAQVGCLSCPIFTMQQNKPVFLVLVQKFGYNSVNINKIVVIILRYVNLSFIHFVFA